MAVALGKKSIIIQSEAERLSLVYSGLKGLSPTAIIRFKDINDMRQKLREILSNSKKKKVEKK